MPALFLLSFLLSLSVSLISTTAFADTHLVSKSGADSGDCTSAACLTVGYAIGQAASGDTVTIGAGTYTENITVGAKSLIIDGAGTSSTILDGNGSRIFFFSDNSSEISVTLSDLTVQNSNEGDDNGGCIHVTADTFGFNDIDMNLDRVAIKNCAVNGANGLGGGIYFGGGSGGTLTINDSTFSGNAGSRGGALSMPATAGNALITNTTFYNNTALSGVASGGAIRAFVSVTLKNCTVAGNEATTAGGIFQGGGTFTLVNTILDDNTGGNCSGTITTGQNNISSDASCGGLNHASDQNSTDPLLGAFQDNGGPVFTMRLQTSSPAIDAGSNANCAATDARGETRPADGDGNATATCDIGAYEIVCGDNIEDAHEECDDGNGTNTDACTNTCEDATCGDGFIRTGVEECDNAGTNSNTVANACRTDCTNASCGDAVVDTGETCDDGNALNTDSCLNSCVSASCGDEIIQASNGETCDNGNANSNTTVDACRTSCLIAHCGDGIIDTGESCDDENATSLDGCSNACALESYDDLAEANGNIDFSNLSTNQEISLVLPDPSNASISSKSSSLFLATDADCDCSWQVSPNDFGTIENSSSCAATMTITSASGRANLSATADCGVLGSNSYNQTLIVTNQESDSDGGGDEDGNEDGAGNGTGDATAVSGGGCQLNPRQDTNIFYYSIFLIVFGGAFLFFRWKKFSSFSF